jgi:hypothetical protein
MIRITSRKRLLVVLTALVMAISAKAGPAMWVYLIGTMHLLKHDTECLKILWMLELGIWSF